MDSDPSSPQSSNLSPSLSQNNSNNNKTDTNVVVVVNGGEEVSDDTDGFVSGQEDFETASDKPLQPSNPDDGAEDDDDSTPFVNSSEFFTPFVEKSSLEDTFGDSNEDAVGGVSKGDVLKGVKLELEGEVADDVKEEFHGENNGVVEVYGLEKDEENHEVSHGGDVGFVEAGSNSNNLTSENETKGSGDSNGDSVASEHVNPNSASGIAEVPGEKDDDHTHVGVINDSVSDEEISEATRRFFEALENQSGHQPGAYDALINAIAADFWALTGKKEGVEESEIKVLDGGGAAVIGKNEFDPLEMETVEAFDKLVNGDSDQSVDTGADVGSAGEVNNEHESEIEVTEKSEKLEFASADMKAVQDDGNTVVHDREANGDSLASEYVNPNSSSGIAEVPGEEEDDHTHVGVINGSVSDEEGEEMVFGSSEAAKRFLEELEKQSGIGSQSGANNSQDDSQRIDGQIVTDSEDEADTDDDEEGKPLLDSATLAALLKAGMGSGQDGGGGITLTSKDGSRLFSIERPAGLGPSLRPGKPPSMALNRANLFTSTDSRASNDVDTNLSDKEKKKLEKLQQISVKYLRVVHRMGFTPEESLPAQVLHRLTLIAGWKTGQIFSIDAAKESARLLEADGKDDFNCSLNVLVLGKTGVGKSAMINSILGETKANVGAYGSGTTSVTEIVGMVDGVKLTFFDTPGLKSSSLEQSFNRKVLSMVKKVIKKSPPDIVLYVDRLDAHIRDLNDLPMLRSVSSCLGPSIWQNAIVALTHGASAPPDGPSGNPLSYDVFVAQRSHSVQQTIGQAVGDMRLMNPGLMNPVALVENHPSCRKNRDGEKVLPNGQTWRPTLLLLCHSIKILAEAGNLSKVQESFDPRKVFGLRTRAAPLPYLLSWLLQSRTHPTLPTDQGGIDNGDSVEMADLSDSDLDEDEDEYDQLPPFKPLKKSQLANLSKEQQKAYFEEYEYRVKLLQKKMWRGELKRMRDMKKKGKTDVNDYDHIEEDDHDDGAPASVPVPLPDMALPLSFDSDNPAYRYRFLEPTSQLLTRPVLDTHSWDHDCGYDGVNLEQTLAIINKFPAAYAVQLSKDKKDFTIHLDSSIAAKYGENGSSMAGFDIQNVGKQLAYILRGETKFKNFKRNKTAAGFSVTFLGENVSTGLKLEDQIAVGKRLVLVGSAGVVRSQGDSAYGSNVEIQLRDAEFPIGQDQYTLGLSLVSWRGDLALGANFQSQISIGRSYKMAIRAGLNNKLSGQISVRTSSSDQLQIALLAIVPIARAIYRNFWPKATEEYPNYY